uniref:Uncharacterized protein n=1 Tax=Magallana gigas TaxID=29159 RepID=K1R5H9_MAGGI
MDQKSESGFFESLGSHVKKTITDPSTLNKEEERAPAHGNRAPLNLCVHMTRNPDPDSDKRVLAWFLELPITPRNQASSCAG